MKRSRFTEEQIIAILHEQEAGAKTAELTALVALHGKPGVIVSDNGTEFTSNAILAWAEQMQVNWHYIAPASPCKTVTARRSTAGCATNF